MGWRRKGRSSESQQAAAAEEDREKEASEELEEGNGKGFFACYLLCSLSPRRKGHTYIGFTVNPRRRIRQHNGEMRSGAWRTKRGRPWEMILCIYGFPSMVSALQFEWAWQHPIESLAVRKAASSFKSLAGIANKIKLAYTMLNLPSWENLNLVVNFFSTKYMKHTAGCPRLPKQMRITVCTMDELPCYTDGWSQDGNNDCDDDVNEEEVINGDVNNSSSLSDIPVTGFTGDEVSCKGSDDSLSQESHRFTEPPVYTADYERMQSGSSPFAWSQESGIDHSRRSLTPINSSDEASTSKKMIADTTLLSSDSNVINLATPPSCTIPSRSTKRALAYSEVIDLTDSPIIIQL